VNPLFHLFELDDQSQQEYVGGQYDVFEGSWYWTLVAVPHSLVTNGVVHRE
jgi:hypothetical protein